MQTPAGENALTASRDIAEAANAHRPTGTPHRTERDNLDELVRAAEAEHGPIAGEEIQALRKRLREARLPRLRHGGSGPSARTE